MCYYITLAVLGSDTAMIDRVLRQHGRQAKPIGNPSVADMLAPGEAQFLTTVGHCDCGTALAPRAADSDEDRRREAVRLVGKGWSQPKMDRWLSDKVKGDDRAAARRHANTPDSVEFWSKIIHDLLATPGVRNAGLLVHFYSGPVESERFKPIRERVAARDFEARLHSLPEDHLLIAAI